jgi:2-hydroxy-3-keto-5-methylthiopentenyl-1-phosphate phosphatase
MTYVNKKRKTMNKSNTVAFCYDFDKTLTPDDMQSQGFIQDLDVSVNDFWREVGKFTFNNNMDSNLSYMYMMLKKYTQKFGPLSYPILKSYGEKITLFEGVDKWLYNINIFGENLGIKVEHYILSSGLREMIEGTKISQYFEKIYASSFLFDENGSAVWPSLVVNYTNKTQFLFRISKGYLDETDDRVNDYMRPEDYRIPFENIIYIGDSSTDVPCMKLLTQYKGHSIGVYDPKTATSKRVERMKQDGRICDYHIANYTDSSDLFIACTKIIRDISEKLLTL